MELVELWDLWWSSGKSFKAEVEDGTMRFVTALRGIASGAPGVLEDLHELVG